jgi:hypothetical protein
MLRVGTARDRAVLPEMFASTIARGAPEAEWDERRLAGQIRRLYRWDARALLGIAGALGRPISRTFVDEVDGKVRGAAVWAAGHRAGWVAALGARDPTTAERTWPGLLERCLSETRRRGRAALLVPAPVAPGFDGGPTGFRGLGFTIVGTYRRWRRELPAPWKPSKGSGLRHPTAADRQRIAAWARTARPPGIESLEPIRPSDLAVPRVVSGALGARTEAVAEVGSGGPVAFVRVTVSDANRSAHLTVLRDGSAPAHAGQTALHWALGRAHRQGALRAIAATFAPEDPFDPELVGAGFAEVGPTVTWARRVGEAG